MATQANAHIAHEDMKDLRRKLGGLTMGFAVAHTFCLSLTPTQDSHFSHSALVFEPWALPEFHPKTGCKHDTPKMECPSALQHAKPGQTHLPAKLPVIVIRQSI